MSIVRYFLFLICFMIFGSEGLCLEPHLVMKHRAHQDPRIKNVTIKRFCDNDIKTIRERFDKKNEHQYYRCFARDSDATYNGVYFIIGLNKSVVSLPKNISINIYLISSLQDDVRFFKCKVSDNRSIITSEIYCGITSDDIEIKKIKAWKIEFVDENGNVLFSKRSYLWER